MFAYVRFGGPICSFYIMPLTEGRSIDPCFISDLLVPGLGFRVLGRFWVSKLGSEVSNSGLGFRIYWTPPDPKPVTV